MTADSRRRVSQIRADIRRSSHVCRIGRGGIWKLSLRSVNNLKVNVRITRAVISWNLTFSTLGRNESSELTQDEFTAPYTVLIPAS